MEFGEGKMRPAGVNIISFSRVVLGILKEPTHVNQTRAFSHVGLAMHLLPYSGETNHIEGRSFP